MMNEETKASLNKFLKEREERIKNMTLAEARDIVSRIYGHSDMRMESDKALQILLDCADKTLEQQPKWIPVSERLPEKNGRYLVTRGLNACGALWNRVYIVNYSDLMGLKPTKIWWNGNVGKSDFETYDDILAWMLLPEPYKEDTE